MAEKCSECGEKIRETFLGKLNGTIIKEKKGDKNEKKYFCSECQRKAKKSL
jgi:uncharacterized protein with PIN domain